MSSPTSSPQLPAPRVVLVLAGAAGEIGETATALERARMPQLGALVAAGRVGRLRTVASHLPVNDTTAAAALLGTVPPVHLDPGAVASEALGGLLAADESCTLVEVVDLLGDPAPALDVQRAIDAMHHQLSWHRIVGVRNGHQVLVAGAAEPRLPEIDGLHLRPAEHGLLPQRQLDHGTVVVADEGSTLLGVASLLGARCEAVDPTRAERHDPVPARLRERAIASLLAGARTVVVETRAPIQARRGLRERSLRDRTLRECLEHLDRELIGPLRSASAWTGSCLSVTADMPRTLLGEPVRGEVPLVISGPRAVLVTGHAPMAPPPGSSLPPRHCERALVDAPIVTSPFAVVPERDTAAPRRFRRDPVTGGTTVDELIPG
ncbi:MAG: hypothetical protein AAGC46_07265 [Solirubrobacteraceae bacterium]|nr:hypothetical protein [Patulibacter sp.]